MLGDARSFTLKACSGDFVLNSDRSIAMCSRSSMIFSVLQASLLTDLPVILQVDDGEIESASISK